MDAFAPLLLAEFVETFLLQREVAVHNAALNRWNVLAGGRHLPREPANIQRRTMGGGK
jgi:hypothetical protein